MVGTKVEVTKIGAVSLIGIEFLASYYPDFAKEPKVNTVGAVLAMLQDEYSLWRSKFELHPKAAESGKTELR
jgi:hypothetical protein